MKKFLNSLSRLWRAVNRPAEEYDFLRSQLALANERLSTERVSHTKSVKSLAREIDILKAKIEGLEFDATGTHLIGDYKITFWRTLTGVGGNLYSPSGDLLAEHETEKLRSLQNFLKGVAIRHSGNANPNVLMKALEESNN